MNIDGWEKEIAAAVRRVAEADDGIVVEDEGEERFVAEVCGRAAEVCGRGTSARSFGGA